ncbi:MAG: hypothetical protein MJH09_02080 [Cetobacterium sp.]|nr:hypothetical protein [Cetobacterium sp.]
MLNGNFEYLAMLMITGIIYFTSILNGIISDEIIMMYYVGYIIFIIMQIFVCVKSTRR